MREFKQAPVVGSKRVDAAAPGTKAKVYFTRTIDAEHLLKLYNLVNENIYGKVAIKLHTGEKHGPNILPRDMVQAFQAAVPESAIVETNTLYPGDRYTTEGHRDTLKVNGWTFCPVDILDEEGDVALPVRNGLRLKEVHMGGHLTNYDSLIVLTHFKGHAMGGFGGSMKNIAGFRKGYLRLFRQAYCVPECDAPHVRRLRLRRGGCGRTDHCGYRYLRFDGYPGHRPGLLRYGLHKTGRGPEGFGGTDHQPSRTAPAHRHAGTEDGQPSI